jgi:hypothetical protein
MRTEATESNVPDLLQSCPHATWQVIAENHAEYGIPGQRSCAVIEMDAPDAGIYAWSYSTCCPVTHMRSRGRCRDSEAARREAMVWIRASKCPGQVAR